MLLKVLGDLDFFIQTFRQIVFDFILWKKLIEWIMYRNEEIIMCVHIWVCLMSK